MLSKLKIHITTDKEHIANAAGVTEKKVEAWKIIHGCCFTPWNVSATFFCAISNTNKCKYAKYEYNTDDSFSKEFRCHRFPEYRHTLHFVAVNEDGCVHCIKGNFEENCEPISCHQFNIGHTLCYMLGVHKLPRNLGTTSKLQMDQNVDMKTVPH
jgi:hypothetical protein